MSNYIHIIIFAIGLIWSIVARISFRKEKEKYDKQYISLYKEHNTFLIILFLALLIDNVMKVL